MKKNSLILFLIFLAILAIFMFFSLSKGQQLLVSNGHLDLAKFESSKSVGLVGDWEFYPNKLYDPIQFPVKVGEKQFMFVPKIWDLDDNVFPDRQGFATYRVLLKNSRIGYSYGLAIPVINSSYKLWVNGRLLSSSGIVSSTRNGGENRWQPDYVYFLSSATRIELVLQVANWGYYKGGVPFNFTLGSKQDIKSLQGRIAIFDYVAIGGLIIIALFHLGLFALKRDEQAPLLLGLFALVVALRAMTTGESMIYFLGDWVSWDLHYKLYIASQGLMAAIFLKFIGVTFQKVNVGRVTSLLIWLNLGAVLCSLSFTPAFIDDKGTFLDLLTLVSIGFVFSIVIRAWRHREPGVNLFFMGFSLFMLFVIHDIIGENTFQSTFVLLPIGFLLFIFSQSLLLSARYNKSFSLVEYYAKYLEDEVEKQTSFIKQKSEEIISSVKYAKRIQSAMFSDMDVLIRYFRDSFVFSQPKGIVGGDFFWYHESKKRFILALVDCIGHGVPGAFMTLLVNNSLESIAKTEKDVTAGDYLTFLNIMVKKILHKNEREEVSDDGLDIALCIIEKGQNNLNYAGAKIPLFMQQNRVIMEYPANKRSVGYMRIADDYKYKDYFIALEGDMSFYLSSDGFFDQFGGERELPFGKRRFKDIILKNSLKPLAKQKDKFLAEHLSYRGEIEQIDDLSIIGFKL